MELTRSLVWTLSKDIGQMGAKSPEECNEIFSDLTNYLNSKYELNLSANVNQSEIDSYNTLFQCYGVWHRNLTSNQNIIYSQRFEMEFEDISPISSGTFGTVFKARNKYDKANYALKRVLIRNQGKHTL